MALSFQKKALVSLGVAVSLVSFQGFGMMQEGTLEEFEQKAKKAYEESLRQEVLQRVKEEKSLALLAKDPDGLLLDRDLLSQINEINDLQIHSRHLSEGEVMSLEQHLPQTLQTVRLNEVTFEGARAVQAIKQILNQQTQLENLYLANSQIKQAGTLSYVSPIPDLSKLTKLKQFNLIKNGNDSVDSSFVIAIGRLNQLEKLSIVDSLNSSLLESLVQHLPLTLKSFTLIDNKFKFSQGSVLKTLGSSLERLTSLTDLSLSDNLTSETSQDFVSKLALSSIKNLSIFLTPTVKQAFDAMPPVNRSGDKIKISFSY